MCLCLSLFKVGKIEERDLWIFLVFIFLWFICKFSIMGCKDFKFVKFSFIILVNLSE